MSVKALALLASSALLVAGCTPRLKPASVAGECRIFEDPGRAVQGATPADQRWISKQQESGIASCGWVRPLHAN